MFPDSPANPGSTPNAVTAAAFTMNASSARERCQCHAIRSVWNNRTVEG